MYQQTAQRRGNSAKLDFVLLFIFIMVVFFARQISSLAAALPAPLNIIVQVFLLGAIIAALLWVYEKRICSFRYSVVYDPAANAEGEENAEPLPYKKGTLIFERMVADKGKIVECVTRDEIVALLKPGEAYHEGIPFTRAGALSTLNAKASHTLIFRRNGKLHSLRFAPDGEFLKRMEEAR